MTIKAQKLEGVSRAGLATEFEEAPTLRQGLCRARLPGVSGQG